MVCRSGDGTGRGESSVISVVLLIATVVGVTGTMGVYAFAMTDDTGTIAPQVAFTTTYDDRTSGDGQSLTVEFKSGETLDARNVSFVLQGAVAVDPSGSDSPAEISGDPIQTQTGSALSAADEVTIDATTTTVAAGERLDLSEATVRLVWNPESPEIEQTEIIWEWSPK